MNDHISFIHETFNNFIMTEKEVEDLCRMIRVGVDLSKKYQPRTKEKLEDLIKELVKKKGK